MTVSATNYRMDIDGLRGVAVLIVLLYHADFGFSGGFIGVDIFFVISGFLISGQIVDQESKGTFRFAEFWLRRIRRILPASLFMSASTIVIGMILLLPHELVLLGKAMLAHQGMVANIFFWRSVDYFDGPAHNRPLLHTWSLSVEEQFYFLYPFILVILLRRYRTVRWSLLVLVTAVSLVISEYGVRHSPTATFYLLPTRAWELLLGGLVSLWIRRNSESNITRSSFEEGTSKSMIWSLIALFSLGLIGYCSWNYHSLTRFPGVSALLPCVATATLIYVHAHCTTWMHRILTCRPLVFVGLISYSLYLWHWPILVFQRFLVGDIVSWQLRFAALVLSVLLAYISYRWVETPFRQKAICLTARPLLYTVGIASVLLAFVGSIFVFWQGIPQRYPTAARMYLISQREPRRFVASGNLDHETDLLTIGKIEQTDRDTGSTFLLWGDSHAMVIADLLDHVAASRGLTGKVAARSLAPPLTGVWLRGNPRDLRPWSESILRQIEESRISDVILAARWSAYAEGQMVGTTPALLEDDESVRGQRIEPDKVLARGLQRTVQRLQQAGVSVWILEQVPEQKRDPVRMLVYHSIFRRGLPYGVSLDEYRKDQALVMEAFQRLDPRAIRLIDPSVGCFDPLGRSIIGDSERSFYIDRDHLTEPGSRQLLEGLFDEVFDEFCR